MAGRRRFGRVRRLPSGRYQARYPGPDGIDRPAPDTFATKTDADVWLTMKEAEIRQGDWIDPDAGNVRFGAYSGQWMQDRILKTRTRELYDGLLRNHLLPTFANVALADITLASIRRWRKNRLDAGPLAARPFGPVTVAKAYRLLHAIMETAVDDGLIRRNPARIDGAGQEDSDEREVIPLPVVFHIADTIPARWRALVLLATFAQMRFGELAGLTRNRLDLDNCVIRVTEALIEPGKGHLLTEPPKSRAGKRSISFPAELVPELRAHLDAYAAPGPRGLVFVGPQGGRLRRSNFREDVWVKVAAAAGVPDAHFHDLRHTGGTLAATTGATTKELMARLGHSSPRAAMIYQHATKERDKKIAADLGKEFTKARKRSGTQRARKPNEGK
jgi:integrase